MPQKKPAVSAEKELTREQKPDAAVHVKLTPEQKIALQIVQVLACVAFECDYELNSLGRYGWKEAWFTPECIAHMKKEAHKKEAQWKLRDGYWIIGNQDPKIRTEANKLLLELMKTEKMTEEKANARLAEKTKGAASESQAVVEPVVSQPAAGLDVGAALKDRFRNTRAPSKAASESGWSDDGDQNKKVDDAEKELTPYQIYMQTQSKLNPPPLVLGRPAKPQSSAAFLERQKQLAANIKLGGTAPVDSSPAKNTRSAAKASNEEAVVKPVVTPRPTATPIAVKPGGIPPPPPPPPKTGVWGAVGNALASVGNMIIGAGHHMESHQTSQQSDGSQPDDGKTHVLDQGDAASLGGHGALHDMASLHGDHVVDSHVSRPSGERHATKPFSWTVTSTVKPTAPPPGEYDFGLSVSRPPPFNPSSGAPPAFKPSTLQPAGITTCADCDRMKAELASEQQHAAWLRREYKGWEVDRTEKDLKIHDLEQQLDQAADEIQGQMALVAQKDREISIINGNLKALQGQLELLQSSSTVNSKIQQLMVEIDQVRQERDQACTDLATMKQRATQMLRDKDAEIDRLNHLLSSTPGADLLAQANQDITRLQKEVADLKKTQPSTKLQKDLDAAVDANKQLKVSLTQSQKDLGDAHNRVSALNARVDRRDQTIVELKTKLDALDAAIPAAAASRHTSAAFTTSRQTSTASFATAISAIPVTSSPEYQVLLRKLESTQALLSQLQAQTNARVGGFTPKKQAEVDAYLLARQSSSSSTFKRS